ncbi:hypothetical protein AB1Y20_016837 [Prymnesium parvum]|uniref:Uncharacterized protein n=1 Tax=Prymnesium parvum TaxID=97485 RepID=A0AB34ICH4_PRYPA|mmetsp:Transcript_24395/g.60532  ORF Transcript_24395/g.60532 Transcript_24395/m.60532 type:complete len:225 (+) Transcript_24395:51-725(+)
MWRNAPAAEMEWAMVMGCDAVERLERRAHARTCRRKSCEDSCGASPSQSSSSNYSLETPPPYAVACSMPSATERTSPDRHVTFAPEATVCLVERLSRAAIVGNARDPDDPDFCSLGMKRDLRLSGLRHGLETRLLRLVLCSWRHTCRERRAARELSRRRRGCLDPQPLKEKAMDAVDLDPWAGLGACTFAAVVLDGIVFSQPLAQLPAASAHLETCVENLGVLD